MPNTTTLNSRLRNQQPHPTVAVSLYWTSQSLSQSKAHRPSNFDDIPHLNGYSSQKNIDETYIQPQNTLRDQGNTNNDYQYFCISFISDQFNHRIRKLFKRENLPVRLAHKSTTLRQVLKANPTTRECNKKDCLIRENGTDLCFTKNIVYEIKCKKCEQSYIGSTIRLLHDRIKEHFTSDTSSVYKHLQQCQTSPNTLSVKVIGRNSDPVNLRLLEAALIRNRKPKINSRDERSE